MRVRTHELAPLRGPTDANYSYSQSRMHLLSVNRQLSTVNCLLWSVVCLTNLWRASCHKSCAFSFKHQPLTSDREKFFTVSFHWNLLKPLKMHMKRLSLLLFVLPL